MKIQNFVLSFFLLVLMTGCSTGPYQGIETRKPALEESLQVVYLDKSLRTKIPFSDLKNERLESGRFKVSIHFFNNENHTVECQIQVKFKDKNHNIVDETGWMPLLLARKEEFTFQHTSLSSEVEDFTILLRLAR